jgi:hypothetical protein
VKGGFAPTDDAGREGEVIAAQRGIIEDRSHGRGIAGPVEVEAVEIQRVFLDLLGGTEEEGVVDVEGLVGKRGQAGQGEEQQPGQGTGGRLWLFVRQLDQSEVFWREKQ